MAWSREDREALERAIATGAKRVRFADREVEYRTLAEMEATLERIKREVGGGAHAARTGVPVFEKGV